MKIFLVAYGCEPNQGGEHEVGWKVANGLSGKCRLTVITRKSNKALIEKFNSNSINFIYVENMFMNLVKKKSKFSYLYYLLWQFSVYMSLKKIVKKLDVVHYITFGNIHLPHFLYLLKSKLILGPMGGGSTINPKMISNSSILLNIKYLFHKLLNFSVKFNPYYNLVFKKSSKIILRTNETLSIIPKNFHHKCCVFLETGVIKFNINRDSKKRNLKNIITTGRLIPSKNIDQVIDVFIKLTNLRSEKLNLKIIGTGVMENKLKQKYNFHKNISFLGKISRDKVIEHLKLSDLFLFCSVKEGGSHSLFEATQYNIPIACYNISGMSEFPKDKSAIKVTPTADINDNTTKLAFEINKYFNKKGHINQICRNGIQDLNNNYLWTAIVNRYLEIYKNI